MRIKTDFAGLKYAYALSGGIGSGKSSACEILSSLGHDIIDADKIAHQVLEEESDRVVEAFGQEILDGGKISRKRLGEIVFNQSSKLKLLNQILAPNISQRIYKQCLELECKEQIYFVEIALLFENQETYNFNHNVLIACSLEKQIWRVCQRDGLSQNDAMKRIKAQLPLEEKLKMAEYVFWNEENKEKLKKEIKKFLSLIEASK